MLRSPSALRQATPQIQDLTPQGLRTQSLVSGMRSPASIISKSRGAEAGEVERAEEAGPLRAREAVARAVSATRAAVGEQHAVALHRPRRPYARPRSAASRAGSPRAAASARRRAARRGGPLVARVPWVAGWTYSPRADRGVRQDEADRVVDPARRDLVGVEQQRRDREPGGVGARALLAAAARRVDARHVPDRQAAAAERRRRGCRRATSRRASSASGRATIRWQSPSPRHS